MCRDDAATSATSATCQVRSGTLHLLKKMLSPSPKKRPRAQKGCKAGRGIWENMGSLGFTYTKRCGKWMKMVMFHIYVSSQDGNPDGKNPFLGTWDVPSRSCMEPPQHICCMEAACSSQYSHLVHRCQEMPRRGDHRISSKWRQALWNLGDEEAWETPAGKHRDRPWNDQGTDHGTPWWLQVQESVAAMEAIQSLPVSENETVSYLT